MTPDRLHPAFHGLPTVSDGDFMSTHWLASLALVADQVSARKLTGAD